MLDIPGLSQLESVVIAVAAFSALVFVHELGHYLACRLIGVRVERFFVGFDAWGMGLKKEINGTVYGIGVIPLGGYVKPAGQADDPRQQKLTGAPDELPSQPLWAQAIMFGAGVFMNFIFGYLLLACAYYHGIMFEPPILGKLQKNGPAQIHGLKPGDRVLEINGQPISTFTQMASTIFNLSDEELRLKVRRTDEDGSRKTFSVKIRAVPNQGARGKIPYIGALPPATRIVGGLYPDAEFAEVREKLAEGDTILAINEHKIGQYEGYLVQELVDKLPGETVSLTIRKKDGATVVRRIRVGTSGFFDLGLRFPISIKEVGAGTPACQAGLRAGDLVVCMKSGESRIYFKDANHFIKLLKNCALNPVRLSLVRDGKRIEIESFKPTPMPGIPEMPSGADTLLGALAEPARDQKAFRVTRIFPGGPAENILRTGDLIVAVNGHEFSCDQPLGKQIDHAGSREAVLMVKKGGKGQPVEIAVRPRIDPLRARPLIGIIQSMDATVTAVESGPFAHKSWRGLIHEGSVVYGLSLSYDLKTTTIIYQDPQTGKVASKLFNTPLDIVNSLDARLAAGLKGRLPLALKPAREKVAAGSILAAMKIAGRKWVSMAGMIFTVLERLVTRKMPLDAVGGPVLLFRSIHVASEVGFGLLLYLVALISINLGVINLLPLPVLDGGHIMFLLIAWVKGSPPSERLKEYAQYVGLVCILALIITVTWYDLFYWLR